jgi:polyribonucleotide nucleotidyltransferase
MIRSITERTGCKIEIHDDGRIDIASTDESAAQQAVDIIRELTAEAELGKTYVGRVVRVVNFGAFVEILPGVEGLLHISEIADHRIPEVRDVLDEGDETVVKVIDIDAQGRVRLSRRAAMREQGQTDPEPTPSEPGRDGRPRRTDDPRSERVEAVGVGNEGGDPRRRSRPRRRRRDGGSDGGGGRHDS